MKLYFAAWAVLIVLGVLLGRWMWAMDHPTGPPKPGVAVRADTLRNHQIVSVYRADTVIVRDPDAVIVRRARWVVVDTIWEARMSAPIPDRIICLPESVVGYRRRWPNGQYGHSTR